MFKIFDGREQFFQWDMNQKLIVEDASIVEVHFCNKTDDCSLVCEVADGVVDVPNILLQDSWDIRVYAFTGEATKVEQRFKVCARTKPADYIYTETEVKGVEEVVDKAVSDAMDELLANGEIVGKRTPEGGEVFGQENKATGWGASAFGCRTFAKSNFSFTTGIDTATGEYANNSYAAGENTFTVSPAQFVLGRYNDADTNGWADQNGNYDIFMVGNGKATNKRSNAFAVNTDGSATIAKQGNKANSVAQKSYVDNTNVALTSRITSLGIKKITATDDEIGLIIELTGGGVFLVNATKLA